MKPSQIITEKAKVHQAEMEAKLKSFGTSVPSSQLFAAATIEAILDYLDEQKDLKAL